MGWTKRGLQVLSAVYLVAACYFGWLYIPWGWMAGNPSGELVDFAVHDAARRDLLTYGALCLVSALAMLLLVRRSGKKQLFTFSVAWLAVLLVVVVASYLLAIPIWIAAGSTVIAWALIGILVDIANKGGSPMSGKFDFTTINLDIEEAINRDHLTVHYQPIFDISTATPKLIEAEALVRWNHPELGMLAPIDFKIWQASERIKTLLTDYVLQRVVEQHVAWEKQNIRCPVAVNLSIAMLGDDEFPESLATLFAKYNVDHALVVLELPEHRSTLLPKSAIHIMDRLTQDGFRIVLDNFGRNAVSLPDLAPLPLAGLKIDAQLIGDLVDNERIRQLVGGIIHLAHDLGIPTCATCVETEETASILKGLDCDWAQGWHFGMPMPPSELTKVLVDQTGTSDYAETPLIDAQSV